MLPFPPIPDDQITAYIEAHMPDLSTYPTTQEGMNQWLHDVQAFRERIVFNILAFNNLEGYDVQPDELKARTHPDFISTPA